MKKKELETEEEVVKPTTEEVVEETAEPTEEEAAKALATKIAKDVAEILSASKKTSEETEEKKEKVFSEVKVSKPERTVIKTKKGQEVKMDSWQIEQTAKWYQACYDRNRGEMRKLADLIATKVEPLNITTAGDGGNLVPTTLINALVPIIDDASTIRPYARVVNIGSGQGNTFNVPTMATKPIVSWTAEQAAKSTSSATFGQISLTPYKLAAIVPITEELVFDSPFNVVSIVTQMLGEAVARAEDEAFTSGNGSAKPTGIDNYTFKIIDAGFNFTNVVLNKVYMGLGQAYRNNAVWIANSNVIAEMASIKDSNGMPILPQWAEKNGVPQLKGRPVLENNYIGNGKLFFIDLSQYWIADKGAPAVRVSDEASIEGNGATISAFQNNLVFVRIEKRVDGELATTRAGVEVSNFALA